LYKFYNSYKFLLLMTPKDFSHTPLR